ADEPSRIPLSKRVEDEAQMWTVCGEVGDVAVERRPKEGHDRREPKADANRGHRPKGRHRWRCQFGESGAAIHAAGALRNLCVSRRAGGHRLGRYPIFKAMNGRGRRPDASGGMNDEDFISTTLTQASVPWPPRE